MSRNEPYVCVGFVVVVDLAESDERKQRVRENMKYYRPSELFGGQ